MMNRTLKDNIRFLCVGAAGGNVGQMLEKKGYKAYYINLAKQDLDLYPVRTNCTFPAVRVHQRTGQKQKWYCRNPLMK